MKTSRFVAVVMTALLAFSATAPVLAAGDRHHDRGRHGWEDRGRGHGHHRKGHKHHADRRDDRRHYSTGYREGYRDARKSQHRHYAPPPRVVYRPYGFQRGHRYSNYYGGPVYVVNDYSRYRLQRPRHGHHWIRDDRGNMLMVAIATGIIADIVFNH